MYHETHHFEKSFKWGTFRRVSVKVTIPLYVLWRKHPVKLRKSHHTYSRTLDIYRIVLGFQFPKYKAKYQLNSNSLDYGTYSSRESSTLVRMPSSVALDTEGGLGFSSRSRIAFSLLRYYTVSAVVLKRGNSGREEGNERPKSSEKLSCRLESIFRMILISVVVLIPAWYESFLQRYIAFWTNAFSIFSKGSKSPSVVCRGEAEKAWFCWTTIYTAGGLLKLLIKTYFL